VGTEAKGPAGRGRPADPDIEGRVLAAALTVYGEVGWAGFTLDRVARRAPVGKAALYRRWPTKEDLEASQYPPRFDEMVQNIVRARFAGARTVVQAAIDRGELPGGTPPDLIIDAVIGRVISLIVLTPGAQRVTINAASIADFVLQAVTTSPPRTPPRPGT
jgi:AcrR family transcriptional regulator